MWPQQEPPQTQALEQLLLLNPLLLLDPLHPFPKLALLLVQQMSQYHHPHLSQVPTYLSIDVEMYMSLHSPSLADATASKGAYAYICVYLFSD